MKIYIGPYKNWFGPYQFVNSLFWFLSEDTRDKIIDYIPQKPFDWLNKLRGERKVKIHIDGYDAWNADHTLSLIILPVLKKLREDKKGAPYVDDEDAPEHLRSTVCPPKENEWDTDCNHFKRWDWVLDEIIWTFEQLTSDWEEQYYSKPDGQWSFEDTGTWDMEQLKSHREKINNGLRLFGKYYTCLWS